MRADNGPLAQTLSMRNKGESIGNLNGWLAGVAFAFDRFRVLYLLLSERREKNEK